MKEIIATYILVGFIPAMLIVLTLPYLIDSLFNVGFIRTLKRILTATFMVVLFIAGLVALSLVIGYVFIQMKGGL